ncbi:MAG: phage tail tape measure protein [Methylobacter sp.]|uniref:phage tail tape measure protein n=1 Tax=Methylobacter sp. TaxID=2051955 RepID=UPI0025FA922C|nr:phage tail tape measure protein [Methylobacter sp.]MCK9622196.1 phage tail tape measure protein [Methylobacter sp.]
MTDKKIKIKIEGDPESLIKAVGDSSSTIDKLKAKVSSIKDSFSAAKNSVVDFGEKFNESINNNIEISVELAAKLGGVKGGLLALANLKNLSFADLFGKFGAHAAALGLQVNQAKKFESSFADVKKVVSGTDEELQSVEQTIKRLASSKIPLGLGELNEIAKSGGQLGIPIAELERYIKTTAQAAVAFDMLSGEAGQAIGGLTNIYQAPIEEIELLLDQINVLGDTTAATERDILEVLKFVGGEGKRFGLLKGEMAAVTATLLSMQKPPEVVRTSLASLFSVLTTGEGRGDKFNETLQSMGLSADKLALDINANPKAALLNFLEVLGRFDKLSQTRLLYGLFGAGTDAGSIGDLAGAVEVLKSNLDKVKNPADVAGSALKTFEARADTLDNKLKLATNSLSIFAIEAGNPFLAPVKAIVDGIHGMTDALASFAANNPAITALVRIISLVGSLSLLLSTVRSLIPLVGAALTRIPAALAFLQTFTLGRFAVQFAGAGVAIAALTGLIGGLTSLSFAAAIAVGMIGYQSVIAFRAAGGAITVFQALMVGLRTTALAVFATFGGGWIAAALIGISSLFVAYTNFKDNLVSLGGVQAKVSEFIGAGWAILSRKVGQAIDIIIAAFSVFGDWLSELTGINADTWNGIVSAVRGAASQTGIMLKGMVNVFYGAFTFIGQFVGIKMAEFVEIMRARLHGAVAIAQAAGRDIRAALTGDFSASESKAAISQQVDKVADLRKVSGEMTKDAFSKAFTTDHVGNAIWAVTQAVADEVKSQRAKSRGSVASINESRATGGSVSLPPSAISGGGGLGRSKGFGGGSVGGPSIDLKESEMPGFEDGLTARKLAYERENELREFSKEQELAYWQEIIALYSGNQKTRSDIQKKIGELEVQIIRENAQQKLALTKESLDGAEAVDNDALEIKRVSAQQELDLGKITQAELLQRQEQFENERYQTQLKYAQARQALIVNDALASAQSLNDQADAAREHAAKIAEIHNQQALENQASIKKWFDPIQSAVSGTVDGLLAGTMTRGEALRNIFQNIAVSYAQSLLQMQIDRAADWAAELLGFGAKETTKTGIKATSEATQASATVAGQAVQAGAVAAGESTKTGATLAGLAIRGAAEAGAAVKSVAMTAWATLKKIASFAAEAAAATYASVSAIPFIGWALAPIAAAVAFAGVMMLGGSVMSAKDGEWDVQKDGQMYKLHEQEMVLPAQYAAPLRKVIQGMANGGQFGVPSEKMDLSINKNSAMTAMQTLLEANKQRDAAQPSGGSVNATFNVQAMDSQSVKRFFDTHGGHIVDSLSKQKRAFNFGAK